ncbi:MAG: AAA family ATPase [Archaeoglobus sp.]|uniref:ATP-binding protein n=1 Tax=Archaeoglobus sp. TaxID=1872626 RepID=UPI001E06EB05|nr:AAA family ATPase [Archaeoglobus sp.]MBO8180319.1 AAA family ATPase [Archaeoglobus sp.]
MRIAVVGKGGVGKTSISAMLVKLLSENHKILAVDADPAGGLAMSLGVKVKKTLNDVREEIIELLRQKYDKVEIAASVDYKIFEVLVEGSGFALLAVGRPEEEGCYCQLNTMLREAIEILSKSFDYTIIDGEAGIEQINRRVMRSVDSLLVVTDMSKKGFQVAEQILKVAKKATGFKRAGLIVNRVKTGAEVEVEARSKGFDFIHVVPEDEMISKFDVEGKSFLELPECAALKSVRGIVGCLDELI